MPKSPTLVRRWEVQNWAICPPSVARHGTMVDGPFGTTWNREGEFPKEQEGCFSNYIYISFYDTKHP